MEFYQLDQMRFISDSMVSLILKIILTFEENIFHEAKAMIDNYSLLSKQNSFPLLPSVRKL